MLRWRPVGRQRTRQHPRCEQEPFKWRNRGARRVRPLKRSRLARLQDREQRAYWWGHLSMTSQNPAKNS